MKLPWNILRTNPYWRFAGKNQKVGQKCDFPTKFWGKIFLKRYISPQGHASASQPMIVFCWALSVEHVCQIWWRSDLNSGRYSDFLGAFFDIFCICRFISAVFAQFFLRHSPKDLPWPVYLPEKPFGPKYEVSAF